MRFSEFNLLSNPFFEMSLFNPVFKQKIPVVAIGHWKNRENQNDQRKVAFIQIGQLNRQRYIFENPTYYIASNYSDDIRRYPSSAYESDIKKDFIDLFSEMDFTRDIYFTNYKEKYMWFYPIIAIGKQLSYELFAGSGISVGDADNDKNDSIYFEYKFNGKAIVLKFDYGKSIYTICEKESEKQLWIHPFIMVEEYSVKEIYNGILKVYELLMGDKHEPEK